MAIISCTATLYVFKEQQMNKLSFKLSMNFRGPSADDCIEEIQKASSGVKYVPVCYAYYSDTSPQPQAIIEEEALPIKDNCESIKDVIKYLQSVTLDGCTYMQFHLNLTGDVNDIIKDEYAIQLPKSVCAISSSLYASDMDMIKIILAEINRIADKIMKQYT